MAIAILIGMTMLAGGRTSIFSNGQLCDAERLRSLSMYTHHCLGLTTDAADRSVYVPVGGAECGLQPPQKFIATIAVPPSPHDPLSPSPHQPRMKQPRGMGSSVSFSLRGNPPWLPPCLQHRFYRLWRG